jgi:amino acid adenylation domain-containing protein
MTDMLAGLESLSANPFIEFGKEEIEQSVPSRFEKIARMYPDRVAVTTSEQKLTYDALNQTANRMAHAILRRRGEGNEPIALLLEQSASLTAATIGTLKAGKIYVPLDPYYPKARLTFILENSQATLTITNNKNVPLAHALGLETHQLINIDELDSAFPSHNLGWSVSPDSLAWIIYTSGSTGQPKGVMQSHRNVLHEIMNYTNEARISLNDRLALVSSPSFADAVRTTYAALLNGASLYPLDIKKEEVAGLPYWLTQQEITVYRSVPSVFRRAVSAVRGGEMFPKLRLIYLAGDSVSKSDVELYKKHFSRNCILVNGLGSTESLTFRWYFIDQDTQVTGNGVPVGYEIEDKQVLLLDEAGQDLGVNCFGEIAVKSRYLSPGYWRRPDLTETAFTLAPDGSGERIYRTGDMGYMHPNGCLEHRGRKDFQVKVRGHRIEVSEIETTLLTLGSLKETVVVSRQDRSDEKRLVAYIVPTAKPGPTISSLCRALSEKLPDYMIPSNFVFLDALPLTPNGKLDRMALPDPSQSRPELDTPFVPPMTPVEEKLAKIWAEVLSLDRVGIHDNFLELGGHSLAATQVISRVIERLNSKLPLRLLFDAPTVADMAKLIVRYPNQKTDHE